MIPIQPSWHLNSQLLLAIRSNAVDTVRRLVREYNVDVDQRFQPHGEPAVCLSIELGHYEMLACMVELGCSVNQTDDEGNSPLHLAAKNNRRDMVQLILSERALVNNVSKSGISPMHVAVGRKSLDVVLDLFQAGANLDISRDQHGFTPLFTAFVAGASDVASFLISKKADLSCVDNHGNSLMHFAANVNLKAIDILIRSAIETGVDSWLLNKKNTYGRTPLHELAQLCSLEFRRSAVDTICYISSCYATCWDPDERDLQGRTPLIVAVCSDADVARSIVSHLGAKVTLSDHMGITALRCAARYRADASGLIDVLLGAGALDNASDRRMVQCPTASENDILPEVLEKLRLASNGPLSLQACCRNRLRLAFSGRYAYFVNFLRLPKLIKDYLLFVSSS